MDVNATLSFKAGREAATHDVYLSTDEQAVIDGTAVAVTVTETSHAPSLDLAATYYWRSDEVNGAETPTTWQGEIWNLSTQEYIVVDDFESYNDIEASEEGTLGSLVLPEGGISELEEGDPILAGDPLAHVVATAPTRQAALVKLGTALQQVRMEGVATNLDALRSLAGDRELWEGRLDARRAAERLGG